MAVRHARPQALSPGRPAVASGHVGRGPGLVDKDEALGIEIELPFEPLLPSLQDIRTVLFGCVGRLFLRVMA